ncbi:unnamed protein product [Phyllotreta striolata]|uniref:MSP domain-containing protein n=1 Tax=Phyllotreta striolata TaxID=444603 RepID=A0A9P0DM52_PHYSR|nr:unnamed protein product [Phyllotreta striolata]
MSCLDAYNATNQTSINDDKRVNDTLRKQTTHKKNRIRFSIPCYKKKQTESHRQIATHIQMPSKLEQILQIEPDAELKFKGRYNEPISSLINLTNPSDKRVMFKIKTTAPKKYCVRPNAGVLDAMERVCVSVCLQPYTFDAGDRTKHKFLVQSAYAPPGAVDADRIWSDIIPEHLMDTKLRCSFDVDQAQREFEPAASSTPERCDGEKEREHGVQADMMEVLDEEDLLKGKMGRFEHVDRAPINVHWFYFFLSVITGFVGVVFGKYYL